MATPLSNFSQSVSSLLVNEVLTPLATWLAKEKNLTVTVDEMMGVLNIPSQAKAPAPAPIQMPNLPNFLSGSGAGAGSGATATTGTAGGSGRKKASGAPYNGPTCQYVFVRGAKKHQTCGEPCIEGSNFCRACAKKKSAGGPGTGSGAGPAATTGSAQGFAPVPSQAPEASAGDETAGLQVMALPNRPGFYRSVKEGFIIQQQPDGAIVATAIDVNGVVRPLNDEEKRKAATLGIGFIDDPAQVQAQVQAPTQAPSPAVAKVPGLPQIPQLGVAPTGLTAGIAIPRA